MQTKTNIICYTVLKRKWSPMVTAVTAESNMYQAQTEKNSQSFFGLGWEKRYILVLAKAVWVQQVQRCSTISSTIVIIRKVRKIHSLRVVSVVVLI